MTAFIDHLQVQSTRWGKKGEGVKSLAQRLDEYKEDRHYAFVEYSGSNLKHFSFEDSELNHEQTQATSNKSTSATNLCAKAIVIADGDIDNKTDRAKHFANQLEEDLIILPGKEIENLIPEALMREQLRHDNSTISKSLQDKISYVNYSRLKYGIGKYVSNLGFNKPKYWNQNDSGTLSPHMKARWASNDKGIPMLVRQAIKAEKNALQKPTTYDNRQSSTGIAEHQELPSHLTQDLIWLCVCIYAHVAKCNHDQEFINMLENYKKIYKVLWREASQLQPRPK